MALEARVRWLRGGRAAYLREDSIERTASGMILHPLSSRTDVTTVQAGVTFHF